MIWILLESFICIQLLFFQKSMICQNRFRSSISGIKMTRSLSTRPCQGSSKPARLVAEHLISLGHRKITYISTPISDIERSRSKRYDALVATFKEYGFGDDCVSIRSLSPGEYNLLSPNMLEYSSGYNLTKQILEEGTGFYPPSLDTMIWLHLES